MTLAFGGVAVAANVAYFNVLVAWLVLGAVVAIAYRARRLRQWRPTVLVRTHSVLVALSTGIVVLAAFGSAMTGPFNANDDDAAYLYLAQRMLSTGGLIDPFNMRRINSYGGAELFQELALRTGNAAGLGIEWFFFTHLTVALVVGSTRRRFAPLLIVIVGLGLVIGDPVGTWANVAPTFSGAALSLALLRILILARRHVAARSFSTASRAFSPAHSSRSVSSSRSRRLRQSLSQRSQAGRHASVFDRRSSRLGAPCLVSAGRSH